MDIGFDYLKNQKAKNNISRMPLYLITIMVIGVLIVELFVMYSLYLSGYKHQGEHLYEMVESRAKIYETVAYSNLMDNSLVSDENKKAMEATLLQIEAAHSQTQGFGKTGEFVMARKEGDYVEFILDQRHSKETESFKKISLDSSLALPMRLALEGKSGVIEALDYRGEPVLAAYTPIDVHSWGLVSKIDLAEIRFHYLQNSLFITLFSLFVMGLAGYLFFRRTAPLLKRLNKSESIHRSIFENAHDAIVMVDQTMNIVSVNPEALSLFGYKDEEIIGQTVQILIPEAFRARHENLVRQSIKSQQEGPMDGVRSVSACHKNGHEIPVDISLSKLYVDGKIMFAALMRDISDRKNAENLQLEVTRELEKRVNERTLELTVKNQQLEEEVKRRQHVETELLVRDRAITATANGILISDNRLPDNPIIYVNPGFEKITGYSNDEILGKNCRFLHGSDTDQSGLDILRKAIKDGENCKVTIRNYRADGTMFWNQLSISPVFDDEKNITHFIGIQEDITAQKLQAEENENLALVVENTSNAVIIADPHGKIQWANDSFNRFIEIDIENSTGIQITDFGRNIEENKIQLDQLRVAINDQSAMKNELKLQNKSGDFVWVELNMQPVFSDLGLEKFIVIGTDITERKNVEKALLESQERFALVLEGTNDGIWDWNILTDKVYYSPHFFELLNYSKNYKIEYLEFFVDSLVPDSRLHVWQQINRHLETKEPFDEEFQMQTRDGNHRWFRARGQAIWNEKGLPVRMSGSLMDITERVNADQKIKHWNEELEKRVEERTDELIKAKEIADSANRAKSAFLAAMSHELRTPMNGVVGMVDLLRETELSHDQRKMVHTARDSALGLLTIIDDILDFSKIEAGKLEIEKIPFSLGEVTESVAATLSSNAHQKGINFEIYIDPALPGSVLGDPVRIRQILYNLGGNAIKFTDNREDQPGQVRIRLEQATDKSSGNYVKFKLRVIDNGIGMPKEVQDKLFKPFVQAESSTTRRYGGSGLGLSITQRLVEILNGQIWVISEEGKGSEFCVELSLAVELKAQKKQKLQQYSGLIVNEDSELADAISDYLSSVGARITVLKQMQLDESILNKYRPDFVVLDGEWFDKEKENISQNIGNQKSFEKVKYLITTKRNGTASPSFCEGTEYIQTNPLLPSDLLNGVEIALRLRYREEKDQHKGQGVIHFKVPTIEAARKTGQLILVAEDNSTNREVIRRQLNRLGYAVELAHHGRQAFDKYKSGTYGILLTDCHMPQMDGFQLTEAVRNCEKTERSSKRIPIIAITANAIRGEAERCYEAGMDDFLSKPVELKNLKAMLDKWLPIHLSVDHPVEKIEIKGQESGDAFEGVSKEKKPSESSKHFDSSQLERLVGDDPEIIISLLNDYQKSSAEIEEQINIASDRQDLLQIGKLGHKLKSAARAVGAPRLGDICEVLQNAGKVHDEKQVKETLPIFFEEYSKIKLEVNDLIELLNKKLANLSNHTMEV